METKPELETPFPVCLWGEMEARFLPKPLTLPEGVPVTAALVFAMQAGRFALADIEGRGWCTLGGHLEAAETPEEAVRREAWEEAGATLGDLHLLGAYHFHYVQTGRCVLVATYWAEALAFGTLPAGTESRGVCIMGRDELPERYFYWDVLMEAVFDFALSEYHAQGAGHSVL